MDFFAKNFRLLVEKDTPPRERIAALGWLLLLLLVALALLLLLVFLAKEVLPIVLTVAFFLFLFLGDHISAWIARHRADEAARAASQEQWAAYAWHRLAVLILPSIEQVTQTQLTPEDIACTLPVYDYGSGFFFEMPRLLTEQEGRLLRQKLLVKMSGRLGVSRTMLTQAQAIIIHPDYVFIRCIPQMSAYFAQEKV